MSNIVVTAANSPYFESLKTLVASIHRTSISDVDEIVVYDLGLDLQEVNAIETWEKCRVVDLQTAIGILPYPEYLFPKWHGYKCFCLYDVGLPGDSILWLDAGVMTLQSISEIFNIIAKEDYFCVTDQHLNKNYTSYRCREIMQATETELEDKQLSSGILGYKKQGQLQPLITEAYRYSQVKDCVCGDEQNHRHDQSIYSILTSRYNINNRHDIDKYGYWTDHSRNIHTAREVEAVIFVHRRGYYDNTNLKIKTQ